MHRVRVVGEQPVVRVGEQQQPVVRVGEQPVVRVGVAGSSKSSK